jgi:hypothetical protein
MSPDERTTELIHLAVDGEATERDLAELDELLGRSAEARVIHDEIEDLVRQLNGFPAAEPPNLKRAILDEIGLRPKATVTPIHQRRRRMFVAAAYAVAASIVIGVAIDRLIGRRDQPVLQSQASASMIRLGVDDWPQVADISAGSARMVVRRSGDLYAVQPVVTGAGPISISWDAGRFVLEEATPTPDNSHDAAAVSFSSEKKPVTIILHRRPDAFGTTDVHLSAAGNDVLHATVTLD